MIFFLSESESFFERRWVDFHSGLEKIEFKDIDIYDSTKGWILTPNLRDRPFKGAVVNSNSDGARGKEEVDFSKTNVLFLGDSFCFGEGVSDHETIPYFFEKHFDSIRSINFGVHGYGIDQQYIRLKEVMTKYRSPLTCFIIFFDDFRRVFTDFRDYAKPKYILRGDEAILTNCPVPPPDYYLHSRKRDFRPLSLITELPRQILIYYGLLERAARERTCAYLLDRICETIEASGSKPLFVYVPNFYKRITKNYIDSFFLGYFTEHDIVYLNVADIFPKAGFKKFVDQRTSHITPEGNRLIAEKLADLVQRKKWLGA